MWISRIDIAGFGVLQDWSVELDEGLQLIVGNNGEGKTTVLQFIRSCLFGMAPRGHQLRYEIPGYPYLGGRLTIQTEKGPLVVERLMGQRSGGQLRLFDQHGHKHGETQLQQLLAGVSRSLYQQVFAITIDDLNQVDLLEGEELRNHLYSVGFATATSVMKLERDLKNNAERLYKPRGRKPVLNELRQRLQEAEWQLQQAEDRQGQFRTIQRQLQQVEDAIAANHRERSAAQAELDTLRRVAKSEPLWHDIQKLRRTLRDREDLRHRAARLADMSLAAVSVRLEHTWKELERSARDLALASEPLQQHEQMVLQLRQRLHQLVPTHLQDQAKDELLQELQKIKADEATVQTWLHTAKWERIVPWGWWFIALGAQLSGGPWSGPVAVLATLAGVGYLVYFWLRDRRRQQLVSILQGRQTALGPALADPDIGIAKINEAVRLEEELARVQLQCDYHRGVVQERTTQHEAAQQQWNQWQAKLDAESLAEAQEQLAALQAWEQDQQRLAELEEQLKLIWGNIPTDRPPMTSAGADAIAEASATLEQLDKEQQELLESKGKLGQELIELQEQTAVAHWTQEAERLRTETAAVVQELAVTKVMQQALEAARIQYETHKQPRLLQAASRWLQEFTLGQYRRISVPIESRQLLVEDNQGRFWPAEHLSRGTVEQLYLALRLAVIRMYSEQGVKLPIVLDEVFVNFDGLRSQQVLRSLQKLAQEQQILILTCRGQAAAGADTFVPMLGFEEVKACHPFQ